MSIFRNILLNLPEVQGPTQKRLPFKEKLKWTGIMLGLFFLLGMIPLFGLDPQNEFRFEQLEIILGAKFGSIISLGIGPLVTASIVLQLLTGAGILKFDLTKTEDKAMFQGLQKAASIFFILFEGFIYVFMGGLTPPQNLAGTSIYFTLQLLLVAQLFIGGFLIMFMDEVVSKWGFGSGISLFIAAGVSKEIFIKAFSWLPSPSNPNVMTGRIPAMLQALSSGSPDALLSALLMGAAVIATVLVFVMAVYGQAMKVEIPLSFGRVRGHGVRWPLNFIYTSNIPVILVSAFLANLQLWARLMENWGVKAILGKSISGMVAYLDAPNIVGLAITGSLTGSHIAQALVYMLLMVGGSVLFSIFWVQTSGMDAASQAKNMMSSGLHIPGFRKDQRILERLLSRYIWPLTVMGAIFVGFLAAVADLAGALSRGTGILLAVMIIYKLYEDIARQHMMDMHPVLKRFMQ
ncbi:preprotein translocase subunit SecY [Candidatus Woesearchaeota archaeon]|nr:preprotein translocase subunit SecY [Candidatus Woesearchaeota archaeon]